MMSKKAVDVVLLPDEMMAEKVIEANAKLVEKFGAEIVLDKERCLPHISLAMGCIEDSDTGEIEIILRTIAQDFPPGPLKTAGLALSTNAKGRKVSVLVVAREKKLQSFHEEVMVKVEPYFKSDVSDDMIYPSGPIAESTLLWIKNYRTRSCFEKFLPHITLGYGELENLSFPEQFTASKLALCHLGNHCTCRDVLVSVEL